MSRKQCFAGSGRPVDETLVRELRDFLSEAPEYVCVARRQHRRFKAGDFSLSSCAGYLEFQSSDLRIRIVPGGWNRTTHRFIARGRLGGLLLKPSRKNELWLLRQRFRWHCEEEICRHWKLIRSGFVHRSAGGAFLRMILQRREQRFAAIAVADEEKIRAEAALAQLLTLWNKAEQKGGSIHGGLMFLSQQLATSAARLASDLCAPIRIFQFPQLSEVALPSTPQVPLLWPSQSSREGLKSLTADLSLPPEVQAIIRNGKEWSFEYLGIPFAQFLTDQQCWRLPLLSKDLGADGAEARLQVRDECHRIRGMRRARSRSRHDPLYQLYSERWLESLILRNPKALDPQLRLFPIYSQVPAYVSQRRVIDIVAITESGRLTVIEVKVQKSIDLLLQGLAYWRIVFQAQQENAFQKNGYFDSLRVSEEPPLLYCVTPLLSLHADQRLFARHLRPEVEVYLIGVNNDWRNGISVLRKERL